MGSSWPRISTGRAHRELAAWARASDDTPKKRAPKKVERATVKAPETVASNYPSGLDSVHEPAGTDNLAAGIGHAAQHANANDAIEAIESTLGLNPQGASATVKARLDAIEADSWVTSARILDGTIVNGDVGVVGGY